MTLYRVSYNPEMQTFSTERAKYFEMIDSASFNNVEKINGLYCVYVEGANFWHAEMLGRFYIKRFGGECVVANSVPVKIV